MKDPRPGDEVARLIDLCRADSTKATWSQMLEERRRDVAIATGGKALTIEVAALGCRRFQLGFTPEGDVIQLTGLDRADVRLQGTPEEIAAFILGEQSLIEAMLDGLVVTPGGTFLTDTLSRTRRLVRARLREILAGHGGFGLLFLRRLGNERRQWNLGAWAVEISAAVSTAAPRVLGGIAAAVAGLAPAAAQVGVLANDQPTPIVRPAANAAPAQAVAPVADEADRHGAGASRPAGSGARGEGTAGTRADVAVARTDSSLSVGVTGEAEDRGQRAWWELRCDTPIRATVCDALAGLPTPGP